MVTYAKKGKVINAMKHIPFDRLMIETDSPYLTPKGVDAAQNSPEYVSYIAQHMADHRGVKLQDVIIQTTQNALTFFNIQL